MRINRYIIVPLLLLSFASLAVGEKQRGSTQQPRMPAVEIAKAIQLAVDHHKKEHPESEDIFVDEAVYVRTKDDSFWKIGVRLKDHETGHLYYKVTAEGKVESHSVVKDG